MNSISLSQYKVTIETLEPMRLPELKGSMFRGGFGSTLRRICVSNAVKVVGDRNFFFNPKR